MKFVSKEEAIKNGLKWYFTGVPCRNGHIYKRRLTDHCLKCCVAATKKYYSENPDKLIEYRKSITIEKRREWINRWKSKNPEHVKALKKLYTARYNKLYPNADYKGTVSWRKNNPEKFKAQYSKRRKSILNSSEHFTSDHIKFLIIFQKNKCCYCKNDISKKYHIDHIMPVALGGDNSNANIQLLCIKCNLKKSAKHPIDFAKEMGFLL